MNDTNPRQPKLMTNGRFVLCLAAVIVGASLHPIREYRTAGTVSVRTGIITLVTFCIGLVLVLAIGWWANRPERGGSNE